MAPRKSPAPKKTPGNKKTPKKTPVVKTPATESRAAAKMTSRTRHLASNTSIEDREPVKGMELHLVTMSSSLFPSSSLLSTSPSSSHSSPTPSVLFFFIFSFFLLLLRLIFLLLLFLFVPILIFTNSALWAELV